MTQSVPMSAILAAVLRWQPMAPSVTAQPLSSTILPTAVMPCRPLRETCVECGRVEGRKHAVERVVTRYPVREFEEGPEPRLLDQSEVLHAERCPAASEGHRRIQKVSQTGRRVRRSALETHRNPKKTPPLLTSQNLGASALGCGASCLGGVFGML